MPPLSFNLATKERRIECGFPFCFELSNVVRNSLRFFASIGGSNEISAFPVIGSLFFVFCFFSSVSIWKTNNFRIALFYLQISKKKKKLKQSIKTNFRAINVSIISRNIFHRQNSQDLYHPKEKKSLT